jgi:hypothetical protein
VGPGGAVAGHCRTRTASPAHRGAVLLALHATNESWPGCAGCRFPPWCCSRWAASARAALMAVRRSVLSLLRSFWPWLALARLAHPPPLRPVAEAEADPQGRDTTRSRRGLSDVACRTPQFPSVWRDGAAPAVRLRSARTVTRCAGSPASLKEGPTQPSGAAVACTPTSVPKQRLALNKYSRIWSAWTSSAPTDAHQDGECRSN